MSKETWKQFADRVKPETGDRFEDDRGYFWEYDEQEPSFAEGISQYYITLAEIGKVLSCSLVGAISRVERVDKPKIRKEKYYGYLNVVGLYWGKNAYLRETRALDENGEQITKDIWVEDNVERYLG